MGRKRAAAKKWELSVSAGMALPVLGRTDSTESLSDFRGKVVLVNMFASWCQPCQAEAPVLRHAQQMLAAHGALLSDARLQLVVTDARTIDSIAGRVIMHGEEENGALAGRNYLLLEGTDGAVFAAILAIISSTLRMASRRTSMNHATTQPCWKESAPLTARRQSSTLRTACMEMRSHGAGCGNEALDL